MPGVGYARTRRQEFRYPGQAYLAAFESHSFPELLSGQRSGVAPREQDKILAGEDSSGERPAKGAHTKGVDLNTDEKESGPRLAAHRSSDRSAGPRALGAIPDQHDAPAAMLSFSF